MLEEEVVSVCAVLVGDVKYCLGGVERCWEYVDKS
jgi:hypothetical protein